MVFKSDKYESAMPKVKPSNEGHEGDVKYCINIWLLFGWNWKHTLFLSANQTSEEQFAELCSAQCKQLYCCKIYKKC